MYASTIFQTEHATRHLTALCGHFAKKVTAEFTDQVGHVVFAFGACDLTADNAGLGLTAHADDPAQLTLLIDVLTRHLERFAFRENPSLEWDIYTESTQPTGAGSAASSHLSQDP